MLSALCARLGGAAVAAAERSDRRLSILIFHRVLAEPDALFPGEMTGSRFERVVSMLVRSFRVLPLTQAVELMQADRLPARSLAITFDDGYADNHDVALPILKRHGAPATFFVATGFIDGGRMFNDTVIECVRRCATGRVDLGEWGLGAFDIDSLTQRRALIDRLLPLVKFRSLADRQSMLAALHRACGQPRLPDDLMMSRTQVQALRDAGMHIGAHTVDHPILRNLGDQEARAQIENSRDTLQAWLQEPVRTFAYPNGRLNRDYALRDADLVRDLGFLAAVSTEPGSSRHGDDLHQLRRFTPWQCRPLPWFLGLCRQRLAS